MIEPKKIIRTKRKTLSLQINENGELIVRVPKFVSDTVIKQFVAKHRTWIDKKVREVLFKKSQLKTYTFSDGEEFLFLGKKLKLTFTHISSSIVKKTSSVVVSGDRLLIDYSKKAKAPELLEKFYKGEAKKIFEERVNYYLRKFNEIFDANYSLKKIKLSSGRRILGSCSASGNMNFSWRIIQAPVEIIDYLVVHEIVHLKERHHKRSFWLKVYKLKPDYRQSIVWLNENWFYLRDFLRDKNFD